MDALGYIADTLDALKAAQDLLAAFDETVQRIAEFPCAHKLYCTDRPMKGEILKVPFKTAWRFAAFSMAREAEAELMKNKTIQKYIPRR